MRFDLLCVCRAPMGKIDTVNRPPGDALLINLVSREVDRKVQKLALPFCSLTQMSPVVFRAGESFNNPATLSCDPPQSGSLAPAPPHPPPPLQREGLWKCWFSGPG